MGAAGHLTETMTKPKPPEQRKRPGLAAHRAPQRQAQADIRAQVLAMADQVFDLYVAGMSFRLIAEQLKLGVAGWKLRDIVINSEETAKVYANANIHRSHHLIESAIDMAQEAAALGDAAGLRAAIDTHIKIAGKINAAYNDKSSVEHIGAGGGPIQLLNMTDEQLLKVIAQGAQEADE
jgi:hypothetical protein